jgi:hypothetical protein
MKLRLRTRVALTALLLAAAAAVAYQTRASQQPSPTGSLTQYLPQGALLSIESPDFASLLQQWENSPEAKAWLGSDNHSVFQNSRLYGRLTDAQAKFAQAAGLPKAGADLLNQVAGKDSVFAWYDVGNLEFLYITRIPAAQAEQSELLKSRGSFERRHAGNADFYLRTDDSTHSTVAFAQLSTPSGDLLLLSTREDLIAGALTLLAGSANTPSLAQEPWFSDASSALPQEKAAPALHMVLNLERIVPLPYFRSYWVQQNITWMKQYRAAVSDLYLEPSQFREERVLLPKAAGGAATDSPATAQLAALVPKDSGVFRAVATSDPNEAVNAIQEKLLGSYTPAPTLDEFAPDPGLEAPQAGSSSDLETRIDTLPPATPADASVPLRDLVQATGLDALLTVSSAHPAASEGGLWIPIGSAVAFHAAKPWNPQALAAALQETLRGSLTTANLGIEFRPMGHSGAKVYALNGPRSLFFAIPPTQPNLLLLTDDQTLLLALLHNAATSDPAATAAMLIAGFDHASQRAPYARLTSLVDATNNRPAHPQAGFADASNTPAFFSGNIRSLSDSFAPLESERLVQRTVDANLRQTVTYTWQAP